MFYYTLDGVTFTSKVHALKHVKGDWTKLRYYYHDLEYSKVDWTVEPIESLDNLYLQQAQRIRDNYDYVALCYSGGYDSTNILETFVFNNIKLDKIVIVGALSQDSSSGVDENHNGELYHNAFPYIEHLGLSSITQVYDYTKMFDKPDAFSLSKYGHDWVNHLGGWYSPHNWFWRDAEKYVFPDLGSRRGVLLFGRDKPHLTDSNTFCFFDTPVNSYGNVFGTPGIDRMNFYWDPTFPQVLVKQLHVLKKAKEVFKFSGYDSDQGCQTFGKVSVNDVLYNLRRPLVFKSSKSKTNILSLRDRYLLKTSSSPVHTLFDVGLKELAKVGLSNFKPIRSRHYSLLTSKPSASST